MVRAPSARRGCSGVVGHRFPAKSRRDPRSQVNSPCLRAARLRHGHPAVWVAPKEEGVDPRALIRRVKPPGRWGNARRADATRPAFKTRNARRSPRGAESLRAGSLGPASLTAGLPMFACLLCWSLVLRMFALAAASWVASGGVSPQQRPPPSPGTAARLLGVKGGHQSARPSAAPSKVQLDGVALSATVAGAYAC